VTRTVSLNIQPYGSSIVLFAGAKKLKSDNRTMVESVPVRLKQKGSETRRQCNHQRQNKNEFDMNLLINEHEHRCNIIKVERNEDRVAQVVTST